MESPQDSWQDEFLSSAEYVLSPPISPAPPSPTLYSLNISTVNNVNKLRVDLQDFKSSITLPIQNDTIECIPHDAFTDVHQQHMDMSVSPFINGNSGESLLINGMDLPVIPVMSSIKSEGVHQISSGSLPVTGELNNSYAYSSGMDDLFECNDEISGNLEELFEDLANARVQLDDDFQPESPVEDLEAGSNWSEMPKFVSTNNLTMPNTFGDDFQQILQDLGLTRDNISTIPGVQLVFANELEELANEGEDLGLLSGDDSMMEADDDQSDSSSSASSIGSDSPHSPFNEVIVVSDENETKLDLFMNDMSNSSNVLFISSPSTASSSDDEDDCQEMILDALMRGDIEAAAGVVSPSSSSRQPRLSKITKSSQKSNGTRVNSALVSQKLASMKPEKRGRKPSSAAAGKSWVNLTDKGLRKKEQNKTAATRYRQKKKMETLYSLEKEQELTAEFDQLIKEKDELGKNISMVKEILRVLFSAKKEGQQHVVKRH